jgi:sirohydrochlorin cobaltochelatase
MNGKFPDNLQCPCGQPITSRDILQRGLFQRQGENGFVYLRYLCTRCKKRGEALLPSEEVHAEAPPQDAVILFSHGSLLCGAGEALQAHAERLRAQGIAPIVQIGYLNYSEPRFLDTVAKCVKEGATRILVLPYFLVPGYFVKTDLPRAVAEAKKQFRQVQFRMAHAIGYDERLADALIASAQTAASSEHWRDDLIKAANHCRANPECPLYGTQDCFHTRLLAGE